MKKYLIAATLLTGIIIYACNQNGQGNPASSDHYVDSINRFCADTSMPNELCSELPYDINEKFGMGYSSELTPVIQPPFDIFSWQSFVALNWPADSNGKAWGTSIANHTDAPRVWENYKDLAEIFNDGAPLTLQLQDAKSNKMKFFYRTSKSPHKIDSLGTFLDADGDPLIDKNLNFAVFEVKANRVESDFIAANNLTTLKGIDSISTAVHHEDQTNRQLTMPSSNAATQADGSMEIKTAWRILDSARGGDIYSRYYTRDAIIFISAANSVTGVAFTIKAKVGLVGMHIIRKTGAFANWIWSTFEHIDNTPDNLQQAQMDPTPAIPWSFYYPTSIGLQPNNPVTPFKQDSGRYKFDSTWPYAKRYAATVYGEANNAAVYGTQAQRVYPIYYRTEQVNQLWRKKLEGTVWANYKLIGSQWATSTLTPGKPLPAAPAKLGNTTLETFVLGSSIGTCIG
jgi:hypothetical protein